MLNYSFKSGIKTSAGQVNKLAASSKVLMYPAQRGSGRGDTIVSSAEYKNGWVFEALAPDDSSYTTLRALRNGKLTERLRDTGIERVSHAIGFNLKPGATNLYGDGTKAVARGIDKNVTTVFMPMSSTDVDSNSHNFNATKVSKVDRAGGSILDFVSNALSTTVGGIIESTTGVLGDAGESLYEPSRNTYNGAGLRERTFTWVSNATTPEDYRAFTEIYLRFQKLSYGSLSKNSDALLKIKAGIDSAAQTGQNMITGAVGVENKEQVIIPAITKSLTNAMVIKTPPYWIIRKYSTQGSSMDTNLIFGPAQILSVTLDNTTEGEFRGLALAPGQAATRKLTITFQETIALTADDF